VRTDISRPLHFGTPSRCLQHALSVNLPAVSPSLAGGPIPRATFTTGSGPSTGSTASSTWPPQTTASETAPRSSTPLSTPVSRTSSARSSVSPPSSSPIAPTEPSTALQLYVLPSPAHPSLSVTSSAPQTSMSSRIPSVSSHALPHAPHRNQKLPQTHLSSQKNTSGISPRLQDQTLDSPHSQTSKVFSSPTS
jgi:hypothetical protein